MRKAREEIGDVLPDYTLTNQMGKVISTSQFRGKTLVFTFIFTRCPFPTFCLRMTQNFADVQDRLKAKPDLKDWHLLTISFDPEYDTPAKLAEYGKIHHQDPQWWSLATGDFDPIYRLTGQFGLYFSRNVAPQDQNHKLRTVVVNPEGRISAILLGNEWTPDDLIAAVASASGKKK